MLILWSLAKPSISRERGTGKSRKQKINQEELKPIQAHAPASPSCGWELCGVVAGRKEAFVFLSLAALAEGRFGD